MNHASFFFRVSLSFLPSFQHREARSDSRSGNNRVEGSSNEVSFLRARVMDFDAVSVASIWRYRSRHCNVDFYVRLCVFQVFSTTVCLLPSRTYHVYLLARACVCVCGCVSGWVFQGINTSELQTPSVCVKV